MEGQLFSSDFLLRGITQTVAWRSLPEAEADTFIATLEAHFARIEAGQLNHAELEAS